VLFFLLQAALLIGLWMSRRKRLQGEAQATLIADISSKFVNLPASEVDREIEDAQRRICECLGLDVSALWQWSMETPRIVTMTHLYRPLGGPPLPEPMYAHEHFPWCQQQLEAGKLIQVRSLAELPPEAARDQEVWRHLGIKATLTFPLSSGGDRVIGALSFNTMRQERDWPEALVKRLQLVAGIFTNALSRKRSDQALHESERRMMLAVEAAEAGLWVLDCATQTFWATKKARKIFEFTPQETISMARFKEAVHPEDWHLVQQNLERSLHAGEPVNVEYRIRLGDGRERWIGSRGRSFFKSSGEPDRMMGVSIDISERKCAEEAFRASEARLAAGVELAGLGYYEVGFGEDVIFADDRFHEICGVPSGRQQGLQTLEFWMNHLHPGDRRVILEEREKLHNGTTDRISIEYRYLHPLHGQKWIQHFAGVARRNASGRAVRTYGVVRDITQRRLAENEVQELRGNLAHAGRVTLLGQLASSLAHELSQPLGAILRNAEAAEVLLQTAAPDIDELRAIVADILSDDHRAGQVIDRLRSLLMRRNVDPQPINLLDVITEVLTLVHADATVRHVKLTFSATPDLPMVQSDRVHLQQVMLNLLVNAIDALEARDANQRSIQVHARQMDPASIEVRVSDNGPGIPAESHGKLFEPFFTTKSNGMGMGLPVSKTIINAHNGKLWAEDGPHGGACFCFTVPVAGNQ
jgi:PAS domain S-box-containing protein